jgi:WD40 repeat protein
MHIRTATIVFLSLWNAGATLAIAGGRSSAAPRPGKADVGRRDIVGDPVPPGAVVRIGTARLRHSDPVSALAVSPDGKWIASHCNWEDFVAVWEAASGKLRGRLPVAGVGRMAFAADGNTLAVAIPTGAFTAEVLLECWDIATVKRIHRFRTEDRYLEESVLRFSADGKHLYFGRASLRRFDLASGKLEYELAMGTGTKRYSDEAIAAVALSRDGQLLITAEQDAAIRIRAAVSGKERLCAENVSASALALSPDGGVLAVGNIGAIELWQMPPSPLRVSGNMFHKRRLSTGNDMAITGLAFSADGKTLLSLAGGGVVALWDVRAGKQLRQRSMSATQLAEIAFAADGQPLLFSADDSSRSLHVWNVRDGKQLFSEREVGNDVTCMSFSADGKVLATGHDDRTLRFWLASTGRLLGRLPLPGVPCQLDFAADGKSLVAGGDGNWWNVSLTKAAADARELVPVMTGAPVPGSPWHKPDLYRRRAIPWKTDTLDECTLTSDGLILDMRRDAVRVSEASSRKTRCELRNGKYHAAVLAANRRSLALVQGPGAVPAFPTSMVITIADLATGEEMDRWELPAEEMSGGALRLLRPSFFAGKTPRLAYAPDSRLVAVGMPSGAILFYDLATSQLVHKLPGDGVAISGLSFAPDGRTLACAYRDATVLVWDVAAVTPKAIAAAKLQLEKHWQDLRDPEVKVTENEGGPGSATSAAGLAWKAHWGLVNGGNQSVSFLKDHLPPARRVDLRPLKQKIKELDSPRFPIRQQAMKDLEAMGQAAETGLKQALKGKISLETSRRLQRLLDKVAEARRREVQQVRAVAVLEQIASPEARRVLAGLAAGDPQAPLTAAAQAAVKRLGK